MKIFGLYQCAVFKKKFFFVHMRKSTLTIQTALENLSLTFSDDFTSEY